MSEYKPEYLERMSKSELLIANSTDTVQAMLRAGAQAMRDLEAARERVKELERALQWDKAIKGVEKLANELREGRQDHNAALQVKP